VLPGLQVETHDLRAVRIFYPDLAVDFHARHREMRLLGGVRLPFLRYRINPQRARGAIEPRHAGLVHQADPEIAVVVDFEIERSLWVIGLLHRDREIRHLSGLRVEPGKELITEMREPDHAVGVD